MIAVSNTGPFLVRWPLLCKARATAGGSRMRASAHAMRCVTGLPPTSTMRGRRLRSKCESLAATSAADVIHFDLGLCGRRLAQPRAQLAVAVRAADPHGANALEQLLVARAAAQRIAQARSCGCEQAGIKDTVRGQARTQAVPAEGLADRGDKAYLAPTVAEGVALCHFTAVIALQRLERPARADTRQQFLRRYDELLAPGIAIPHVHVLNEAHDHVRAAEAFDKIEHGRVVDA